MKIGSYFFGASFLALASFSAPAYSFELSADASDLEKEVYGILEFRCAECHQAGPKLREGLEVPEGGIGYILDLNRVANDKDLVIAGDFENSPLVDVVQEFPVFSFWGRMPEGCEADDSCVTEDEIAVLKAWIQALDGKSVDVAGLPPESEQQDETPTPKVPEPQERSISFVSHQLQFTRALDDLRAQPIVRQKQIRYLSLRVVHNDPELKYAEQIEGYRQGAVKMINAMSRGPEPWRFTEMPSDPDRILMRIYLPDLGWDADTWHLLESHYPYGISSEVDAGLMDLQSRTGTDVPIIRADWFAATATVSPLYYDVLDLPGTYQDLERMLGVDTFENIRNLRAVRAGFQESGVSSHNRLIERHALSNNGFFWTSYDFAGSFDRQSFFRFPMGPEGVFETDELAFEHDGGETIFTLPNGFHGYYLNDEVGARIDVGPTNIVHDNKYGDRAEVVNGISCMDCHDKGMRFEKDTVRDVALSDQNISALFRQKIDVLYPGAKEINDYLTKDRNQFWAALESAGIDPAITAGATTFTAKLDKNKNVVSYEFKGGEPIRALFKYHKDTKAGRVRFSKAANELGLTEEELTARAPYLDRSMASVYQRLLNSKNNGSRQYLSRGEWAAAFPHFLESLTDYRAYELTARPAKPAGPVKEPTRSKRDLIAYVDKPQIKAGDSFELFVEPQEDCSLTLINLDENRNSCVLFPHDKYAPDRIIRGGERFKFPFPIFTQDVGTEQIIAVCNGSSQAIEKERNHTNEISCFVSEDDRSVVGYKEVESFLVFPDGPPVTSNAGSRSKKLSRTVVTVEVSP